MERSAEATVLLLQAFRTTIEHGAPPLVAVRPAVAASLAGVLGAVSLANGSARVPIRDVG